MTDSTHTAPNSFSSHQPLEQQLWHSVLEKVHNKNVHSATQQLIDQLEQTADATPFDRTKVDAIAQELTPEEKYELCDIAGLLVHLQRTASITKAHGEEHNEFFAMVSELKHDRHLTIEKAQQAISVPAFDQVLTAHPTYIGGLEYTKSLNALDEAVASGDMEAASEAISSLLEQSTVVQQRMKVQDETQLVKDGLVNAYKALPTLYEQLDAAFAEHFPEGGNRLANQSYDPLKTKMNITFQGWGLSGDKDGNQNVNYHTTEDAVKTCRKTICHLYQEDLRQIEALIRSDKTYQQIADGAMYVAWEMDNISHNTMATDPKMVQQALDRLRSFSEETYKTLSSSHPEAARIALGIRRNVETFGLSLGKIEYREDAGMLKHALDNVIAETGQFGYAKRPDAQREEVLDALLEKASTEEGLDELIAQKDRALFKIPRGAKSRSFNYQDTGDEGNTGICYHTLKRLDLAARNPDMFKGHVLAEASSPLEFKEMLLLLKLTGNEKTMRIIPLFENPSELENVSDVMSSIWQDKHVRSYMLELGLTELQDKMDRGLVELSEQEYEQVRFDIGTLARGNANPAEVEQILAEKGLSLTDIFVSQVQLAHSDNSRRGGVPGARTAVYKAHQNLREAAAKQGLGMQFFEGGSHTDSFRMGTRSYSALNNTYDTHDFMKSTVQGMDIVQLFGNPLTSQSFIGENIANAVSHTAAPASKRSGTGYDETPVLDTLIASMDRYQNEYFTDDRLGYVMEQVFDYSFNQACGTIASRSAKRGGAKPATDALIYMDPVGGTRTIGYSEALQHAGINPSFIGIRGVKNALENELHSVVEGGFAARATGAATTREGQLHALYTEKSKAFKDVIDRIAYGVAMSDFDVVWDRAQHDYKTGFQKEKTIQFRKSDEERFGGPEETVSRPEPSALAETAQKDTITGFLSGLESEYREAAVLAYEAMTGKPLEGHEQMDSRELRAAVRSILPMYQEQFATSDVVLGLANSIERNTSREEMMQAYGKNGGERNVVNGLAKSLHALRDVTTLTRPPMRVEMQRDLVLSAEKSIML